MRRWANNKHCGRCKGAFGGPTRAKAHRVEYIKNIVIHVNGRAKK